MRCRHRCTASIVFSSAKYASRDIPETWRAMRLQFSTMSPSRSRHLLEGKDLILFGFAATPGRERSLLARSTGRPIDSRASAGCRRRRAAGMTAGPSGRAPLRRLGLSAARICSAARTRDRFGLRVFQDLVDISRQPSCRARSSSRFYEDLDASPLRIFIEGEIPNGSLGAIDQYALSTSLHDAAHQKVHPQ